LRCEQRAAARVPKKKLGEQLRQPARQVAVPASYRTTRRRV